ncbi:MAG: lysostaphin resistance A-like protein [Sphingomonadaceae bacterium]
MDRAEIDNVFGDTAPDVPRFPKIWGSLGWIILYFVLQIICTIVAAIVVASANGGGSDASAMTKAITDNPIPLIWAIIVSGGLTVALLGWRLSRDGRAAQIGLTHFGRLPLLQALGLAVLVIAVSFGFNWLYQTYVIPGIDMQKEITELLKKIPRTPVNIALGFTAVAVIAPLVEELLFRGYLQTALAHRVPPLAAVALSALAFAAVHMQLYATPALWVLGFAFGYLYYKTGSLRFNIVLHMLNNGLALALS